MLVGELARRTGCTPRMIRHYERHGLLAGRRLLNGYRDFPPEAVEQVRRIRTLLDAGMDVAAAQPLLGCVADDGPPPRRLRRAAPPSRRGDRGDRRAPAAARAHPRRAPGAHRADHAQQSARPVHRPRRLRPDRPGARRTDAWGTMDGL